MAKRPQLSLASLEALVIGAAGKPRVLAQLARNLLKAGDGARARAVASEATALAPDNAEIADIAAEILSAQVPNWHFHIVHDARRNAAYDAALRRAIRPDMRVLDIGAGTGLLAMMAARAGAADVVTCEMNPPIAALAGEIVTRNGLDGRVRVLAKHSGDLDPTTDLGGGADLLVSEIVSANMLGQGVLAAMEDAARRLLKPGARMIPARGSVRIALAEDSRWSRERMDMVDGFDLSAFNRLAAPTYHVRAGDGRLSLRSAPQDIFVFDFESGGPFPESRANVTLTADRGRANCIAQWISLDMDDEGRYDNSPATGETSCWAVLVHPLASPLELVAGQKIEIGGSHDRMSLRLWLQSGA